MNFVSPRGVARGARGWPPPMMKSAIKSIHWKVAFKYELATALFYLEKDVTLYPKGISQVFEGCGRENCPGSAA